MKKRLFVCLALAALFVVSFIACTNENNNNTSASHPEFYPILITQGENRGGLQSAVTFSNEFGVGFLLRNETEKRLYYNDDFRLDSVAMSERNNPDGLNFITPDAIKSFHVSWGMTPFPTGIYTFERDFFLDEGLTELYKTLMFEFDVIGWYYFTEDATPIPEELKEMRDERIRNELVFLLAGGASQAIVPASEVSVSRTGVAFSTANISTQAFMHGLDHRLLVYENGWKPAPITYEGNWAITSIGIGMQSGEVIEDRFDFTWLHGALANGRYMILRQHVEDHMRPGAPRVMETLMVQFIIDENTP